MQDNLVKQNSWTPTRKMKYAAASVMAALAIIGIGVVADLAGLDVSHLVTAALTALIPLIVGYMTHADQSDA